MFFTSYGKQEATKKLLIELRSYPIKIIQNSYLSYYLIESVKVGFGNSFLGNFSSRMAAL